MKRLAHVPAHQGAWKAADVELEQDRNRPYAYLSGFVNYDVTIYDISNTGAPKQVYRWTIENPELHRGIGAMDGKYFKIDGRYYFAQSFQFNQGTPDANLGAVIFDVTGLPDTSKVKVVARINYPQAPGGFHNTFAYKHSDGRALYFVTTNQSKAVIYDLGKIVSGADSSTWIVGEVPNPTPMRQTGLGGYHDFYVGYDPATETDKFYGAGLGGYSVFDVTKPETPKQLFTITSLGLDLAHTFTPSPDGRYAVTETEYQYTPLRIWDLEPGQSGKTQNIDVPISAWTSDWRTLAHNHEVRWPYVFVSAYEEGPSQSRDGRALLHVRVQTPSGVRRVAGERVAGHGERHAGCVRCGRSQLRWARRHLRHAHGAARLPHGWLQRLGREGPRHAEHFERAALGHRAEGGGREDEGRELIVIPSAAGDLSCGTRDEPRGSTLDPSSRALLGMTSFMSHAFA
jgi:hypothetical protein